MQSSVSNVAFDRSISVGCPQPALPCPGNPLGMTMLQRFRAMTWDCVIVASATCEDVCHSVCARGARCCIISLSAVTFPGLARRLRKAASQMFQIP
eukprot:408117-Amphidinium_carterae.1